MEANNILNNIQTEINYSNHNTRKFKYSKNIMPDDIKRYEVLSKIDPICKKLKVQADLICRKQISEHYINSVFNNFTSGYYYKDLSTDTIIGFGLWKERSEPMKNSINNLKYIDIRLICSRPTHYKLGKSILFDIEKYGLIRNYHIIKLQPINSEIITYYESNGYKLINSEFNFMEKQIRAFHINKNKISKTRKIHTVKYQG